MRSGLVFALTLLPLAACASVTTSAASLEGTTWSVVSINGQPTPRFDQYRLEFRRGQVGGRLGCNHFGGDYRVAGEILSAGPIAATQMACSEPHMSFESQGLALFQQPIRLTWSSGRQLTLSNAAGSIRLERTE